MLGGLFIFPFERADALSQPRREQIAFMSVRHPRRRTEQSERRLLEEPCVAPLFVLSGRGIVSQTHNLGVILTQFNGGGLRYKVQPEKLGREKKQTAAGKKSLTILPADKTEYF